MEKIRVVELFAGVGGFRLGLTGWKGRSSCSNYIKPINSNYKIVWSNQWEPSTKAQDASNIYLKRFGLDNHSNVDISQIPTEKIPDHDLLVGGFPCQDYSVATSLNQSKGLHGKKGVLWWEIHRILSEKKNKPKYLFFENVDRLLKSPAKQRGRDFAIMLASLSDLGYAVEWRVINAADYGFPQRRRRIFFLGYHKSSTIYDRLQPSNSLQWTTEIGTIAKAFEVITKGGDSRFNLNGDLQKVSDEFNLGGKLSPFLNTGIMINRQVFTVDTTPVHEGTFTTLKDIILLNGDVPKEYYINDSDIDKWLYLKGGKKEIRINKNNGAKYNYAEGAMVFPDPITKASRTIITGEGGAAPSRFKHVIKTKDNKLRRLTPLELERLNMFPDNHTEGASDVKRAFFMGNALVVGIIEKIGKSLMEQISTT